MLVKEVTIMSTLILFGTIALIFLALYYHEEVQPKREKSITQMAERDLASARKRGDIDKGGRCYHGERRIF